MRGRPFRLAAMCNGNWKIKKHLWCFHDGIHLDELFKTPRADLCGTLGAVGGDGTSDIGVSPCRHSLYWRCISADIFPVFWSMEG